MIISVGYEKMTPAALFALVRSLNAVLWDVRSVAWFRVKKGFERDALKAELGDLYEWKGSTLGGRGKGPKPEGIAELVAREEGDPQPVIIMCQEHAPGDCHRHRAIATALLAEGLDVHHIFDDAVVLASELQRSIEAGPDDEPDVYLGVADLIDG